VKTIGRFNESGWKLDGRKVLSEEWMYEASRQCNLARDEFLPRAR